MIYRLLKFVLLGPFLRLFNRPRTEGRHNVPNAGPALLASNHLSVADWLFMPLVLPRRVTFLAKAEYFNRPGLYGALQRLFFAGSGQYPIDRTNAESAQAALNAGGEVLARGDLLGMYPEGTRSPDGRLYRGKTGPARLALNTGVPIVPVALVGTDRIKGKRFPRPVRVTVKFGEPVDLTPWAGREGDRGAEREITDVVMERIQVLSGQEYVRDQYGADVKKKMEALANSGHNLLDQPAMQE